MPPGTLGGSSDWSRPVSLSNSLGGSGGAAANELYGQVAASPPASFADFYHSWLQAVTLRTLDGQAVNGGAAGGPMGSSPAGCGGSGGGGILIVAHAISGSGWIRAHGGNGWNSGGGGGVVVIITTTPRPATQQPFAVSANGGSGGSGGGASGAPGTVLWLVK